MSTVTVRIIKATFAGGERLLPGVQLRVEPLVAADLVNAGRAVAEDVRRALGRPQPAHYGSPLTDPRWSPTLRH
jgi:hypothetical protein